MLGDKIYTLRKNKKISQEEFAEVLNTSRQAVSKWERNESKPDIDKLVIIAKIFNVSIDYLLSYEISYSDVEAFINELDYCSSNNILKVEVDEVRLWCSKYINNFKLHTYSAQYIMILYFNTKTDEYLDLALLYLKRAIEIYSPEENNDVSINDLHKSVCSIYELQQKYNLAKEYSNKNHVYDNDVLLARCELMSGNYDNALEISSKTYLESTSNIINVSFIQQLALLKNNKAKEAYDLGNWAIAFVNSINNNDYFFKGVLELFLYLKAVCEKYLNINNEETIKALKSNNLNSLNKFTVGKSKSLKNYFGKEDPFLIVDIDARNTIKEITSKTSKNDALYKILIDIYNEMFGDYYE